MRNFLKTTILSLILSAAVASSSNALINSQPSMAGSTCGSSGNAIATIYNNGEYTVCDGSGYIDYSTCINMKNSTNNPARFLQDMRSIGYSMGCN